MESQSAPTHPLCEPWTIWSHMPSNPGWRDKDYIQVATVRTVEEVVSHWAAVPDYVLENSLWFMMRQTVWPMYEDPMNTDGGYFSYKVNIRDVRRVWSAIVYSLVGNTLAKDPAVQANITGLSISSKKKFCIVKIWMSNTRFQNPSVITAKIPGLDTNTGMFGLHPIPK